jgi:hypothetical protein
MTVLVRKDFPTISHTKRMIDGFLGALSDIFLH